MLALACAAPTPGTREKRPWHSGRLNGQNRDQGQTRLHMAGFQPHATPPLSQFGILPFIYLARFIPNLTQLPLTPGPQTPNARFPNQKMGQIGTNVGTHIAPSTSYLEKVLTRRVL